MGPGGRGRTELAARTRSMASAVLTGTVDFSTMILLWPGSVLRAIILAALSQYVRSAAAPAPMPEVFVGVLTLRARVVAMSWRVEKVRVRVRGKQVGQIPFFVAGMQVAGRKVAEVTRT